MRVGYLFLAFFFSFSTIFCSFGIFVSMFTVSRRAQLTVRRPTTAVKHHLNTDENVLGRSFPQSFPIIMLRQMVDRNRWDEFFEEIKKKTMNKIFCLGKKGIAKNKQFVGSGLMVASSSKKVKWTSIEFNFSAIEFAPRPSKIAAKPRPVLCGHKTSTSKFFLSFGEDERRWQ